MKLLKRTAIAAAALAIDFSIALTACRVYEYFKRKKRKPKIVTIDLRAATEKAIREALEAFRDSSGA